MLLPIQGSLAGSLLELRSGGVSWVCSTEYSNMYSEYIPVRTYQVQSRVDTSKKYTDCFVQKNRFYYVLLERAAAFSPLTIIKIVSLSHTIEYLGQNNKNNGTHRVVGDRREWCDDGEEARKSRTVLAAVFIPG